MITRYNFTRLIPETIRIGERIEVKYDEEFPLSHYDTRENSYKFDYKVKRGSSTSQCTEFCHLYMWVEADGICFRNHEQEEAKVPFEEVKITSEEKVFIRIKNWYMDITFVFSKEERDKSRLEKICYMLALPPIGMREDNFTTDHKEKGETLEEKCKFKFRKSNCIWGYCVSANKNELSICTYHPDRLFISKWPRDYTNEFWRDEKWKINQIVPITDLFYNEEKCELFFSTGHNNGQKVEIAIQYNKPEIEALFRKLEIQELMAELAACKKENATLKAKLAPSEQ